jgi:hypothetical protein
MKYNITFGVFPAVKIWNVICRVMATSGLVAYVSEESASPSSG